MFKEGTIIYFDPFYFKNGNPAKPKYFIVLKNIGNSNLIASLPTRTDSLPNLTKRIDGCIDLSDINLNCFFISKDTIITDCKKKFDFNTYIYGHQIDEYEINLMSDLYRNEGTDYFIWGKMDELIFNNLINCFKNSKSIKRKYKNFL